MRRFLVTPWITGALASVIACGGSAVDLDRQQGPAANAGAAGSSVVETVPIGAESGNLLADDSRVYWVRFGDADPSWAQSCVFDECAATLTTYGQSRGPLLNAPGSVFFGAVRAVTSVLNISEWNLFQCPATGCNGTPTAFVRERDGGVGWAMSADADALYWVSSPQNDVYRCPLSGCGEVPERVATRPAYTESNGYFQLLLAGDAAYWIYGSSVYSAAKDGSREATRVVSIEPAPAYLSIAVDESSLYWIDAASHIVSCPLAHCADSVPTPLVTTDTEKGTLRVDERGLYWIDQVPASNESMIRFCPLAGCAPNTNPQILSSNRAVEYALDSNHVYWLNKTVKSSSHFEPTIFRVQKPTP
ncbi:MAG: hypothetical protein ABIQ16_18170 [Polyangiaceae bacterium]